MDIAEILTKDAPGKEYLLLGNEAIARGAIEAGLELASTYPGTPSSEIGDSLFQATKSGKYFFEYCTNEKVDMDCTWSIFVQRCFEECNNGISIFCR